MARGKRIREQRRSARRTIRDREQGRNRVSEGSTVRDKGRARENRQSAIDRDRANRDRANREAQQAAAAKKAAEEAQKAANVKEAQAAQKARLAAGVSPEQQEANFKEFQEGFTNETQVEAVGDLAGSVTGGLGKTVVEAVDAVRDFFDEPSEESDTFQARGFRKFGAQVADEMGPTSSGLANAAIDAAAKAHPASAIGKAALDFNRRAKTRIVGPGGVERPAFDAEPGVGAGGRRGRGEDNLSNDPSSSLVPEPVPPVSQPSQTQPSQPEVTVGSVNPGIGISSGTDERVPNFTGSIVVGGRKSRKRRGLV